MLTNTEPARTPFLATDLLRFEFVGDPQVSPRGDRLVYVRTTTDPKTNRQRSAIMIAPTGAGAGSLPEPWPGPLAAVPFTSGVSSDNHPRWSPDGKWLAFLSSRDTGSGDEEDRKRARPQIWVAPTTGGEARPLTAIKDGVTGFVWSPDSRRLAFTALVKPEGPEWLEPDPGSSQGEGKGADGKPGANPAPGDLEALFKKHNEDVKHITRVFYRLDGVGYLESRRGQVFVVALEETLAGPPEKGPATRPLQVTQGDFDHSEPCFSPDGRRLAVVACREIDSDLQEYQDVWVFDVPGVPGSADSAAGTARGDGSAGSEPRRLTRGAGPLRDPSWSPDGRRLAYLGHEREFHWYSDDKVWLVDVGADGAPQGDPRCLTASFGRSFGDQSITDMRVGGGDTRPFWSADGRMLFLPASDHGTTHLHAVDTTTGRVSQVTTGDIVIFDWSVDAAREIFAFAAATGASPNELYLGRLTAAAEDAASWPAAPAGLSAPPVMTITQVTTTNADLFRERRVALPERFSFQAPGGPPVDGWALKPIGWEEGRKYPVVLEIHGGPMAMYTGSFFFEFQLLAAAGIGVLWTNPRGSQGYGETFCAGIAEEWGVNDYADVTAGVEAALERFPWIDGGRLGVAGGSYGGYMTSWIIGHTDRFKAACSMRAVNNCLSFYGTSDTGYRWDNIWHGTPWKDWERLIKQSPITYAGNIKTPTLIIHSENDYRCLAEQGEQLFAALKKRGVEAEFIRYPNESHGLSRQGRPWHRIHRLKSIIDWFARRL